MVAVTYGTARVAGTKRGKSTFKSTFKTAHKTAHTAAQKAGHKSLLVRFFDALMLARTKQAEREIARYRHLLALGPMNFGDLRKDKAARN